MSKSAFQLRCLRIFHFLGGCRATDTDDGKIELIQASLSGKGAKITPRSYKTAYQDLRSIKLPVIGVEFYTHDSQVKGHYPAEWRPYFYTPTHGWLCDNASLTWSQIGFSAFNKQNGVLWDIASRISNQLRICSLRIHQISNAYYTSLSAVIARGNYKYDEKFIDHLIWTSYAEIQTFLTDACILRDYLAEFVGNYMFKEININNIVIRTMNSLNKHILKKMASEDPLVVSLRSAISENGWLKILGDYRDLVIHSAPLISAKRKLFAVCGKITLDIQELPAIRLPIPAKPFEIQKSRASLKHFESFSEQFNEFAGGDESDSPALDGLDYCHNALGMLADLALTLAAYSPVTPEMPHFDETNIIGPVQIKYS